MVSIGISASVTVHAVTAGCDTCGAVLADVPVELAERWLDGHRAPALLSVDLTLNGHRDTWRRR